MTPTTPNQVPQVGDRFIKVETYGWTQFSTYTSVKVTKLTPTMAVLSDGSKLKLPIERNPVRAIGAKWIYYHIPTADLETDAKRNHAGIRAYNASKAFKMPTIPANLQQHQYETITNLIQEFEERLSAALKG